MDNLEKKENELKELQLKSTILIAKENLINIIFISIEEDIYWSTSCQKEEQFASIEKLFYKEYPELMELDISYKCKGEKINRLKSLEDNKIKNNDIIVLFKNKY